MAHPATSWTSLRGMRPILTWGAIAATFVALLSAVVQTADLYHLGLALSSGLVVDHVMPGGPAEDAGLLEGDVLLALDRRPIHTRNHFRFVRRRYRAGDTLAITVQRADGTREVVEVALARAAATARAALILSLVGLSFLVIGSLVYVLNPNDQASFLFFLCCVALAFSYGVAYTRNPWLGLLENLGFLVPSLIVRFFTVFPVHRPRFSGPWAKSLIYAPGVLLLALVTLTSLSIVRADLFYTLTWAFKYQVAGAAVGLAILVHTFLTTDDPVIRQQTKWVVWGVALALALNLLVMVVDEIGPLSRDDSINLVNWCVLIVPAAFALSILRYRLFDIDTVINRSIVYSVVSIVIIVSYLLLAEMLRATESPIDLASPAMVMAVIVLFSILLDPLRQQVQRLVDRVMYRYRPNYRKVLEDLSREMAASLDLERLLDGLLKSLSSVTRCDRIQVFLLNSQSGEYECIASLGAPQAVSGLPAQHPVALSLETADELLCMPDTARSADPASPVSSAEAFMQNQALVLCVPLRVRGVLLGWLGFGAQRSGTLYAVDERRFLRTLADQIAVAVQNALLYRDSQLWARQLATVNRIGRGIASTLDLDTLLEQLLTEVVHEFSVETASLLLVDEETGDLVFEVSCGESSEPVIGKRLPAGVRSIASLVAHSGQSLLSNDVQNDPRWYPNIDEATGHVTRQLVCVPLFRRARPLGVIEILNRRDGSPFTEGDRHLLGALAAEASMAIQNAQLYASTDHALAERVEELSTMQDIDRQLNASLDSEQVMDLTLRWAMQQTGADAGALGLVVTTSEQRGVQIAAARGYPMPLAHYQRELWPLGEGIVGQVADSAQMVCADEIAGYPGYRRERPSTRSELAVPVMHEGRVIGVLNLESDEPGAFGEESTAFVTRLADHAAIALENARLYGQVKRADEAKSEFVSMVSHELKAPMTIIKGYAELMQLMMGDSLGTEQSKLLGTIMSNVEQMQTLISDLLQLARLESGQFELERYPIRIHTVLGEVMASLRHSIDEKQHTVSLKAPAELPQIHADPMRLHQVMMNLISNAVKYTPPGGTIEITAEVWREPRAADGPQRPPEFICCTVRDSGIGISPQSQELLFQRFFRANDPYVRRQSGTGLGLCISKVLVEMHGGRIWAESEPGEGSSFFYTIPLAEGWAE